MKKIISYMLSLVILVTTFSCVDFSAYALSSSGSCGTNVKYSFDNDTGTLTISGSGSMKNYDIYDVSPFEHNSNIKYIIIAEGVRGIGNCAFESCGNLESVSLSSSVTKIGYRSFYDCSKLKSIIIPDNVSSIGNAAFHFCTALENVTIGKNLSSIGNSAFSECWNLCNINIPSSVRAIGSLAFSRCNSLLSLKIPNSTTDIYKDAFKCVRNVEYTGTASGLPWGANTINGYIDGDFVYSNSSKTELTGCPAFLKGQVVISDGVTRIGDNAFFGCTGLTSIRIPDSVTSIGSYTFYNCSCLKNVYYCGTEELWKSISVGDYNDYLLNATIQHDYHIHSYVILDSIEATCLNNGLYIYECSCGDSYIEEPKALGHIMVIDEAVLPTCTETGLTQGSHCSRCGMVEAKQEIVETYGGHSFTNYISDSNATCLEDGTKTAKCDRCDETNTVTDVDSKLGHSYVATITKPTCTEGGYTTYNCSRCEDSYVGDYTEALGHTPSVINAVAPTCTETGLTEGSICSVCGVVLIEQQIISANGHKYELYRTTATCEKAGYDVYKCSVCSSTKTEKVDAHHTCDTFVGVVDGELNYSCSACGKEYTQSASEIFEKWDSSVINVSAEEFPELDVVNDGIINAKDYAMLNHIKNYGY